MVNEALKDIELPPQVDINKIIDDVIATDVVDKILTNQLTQEILERTIQYAVADIMDIIKLPTTGEVVETSKEELIVSVIEDILNAPLIKKEGNLGGLAYSFDVNQYHELDISLNKITWIKWEVICTPKGWNRDTIKQKIQLDLLTVLGENTKVPDLSSIDYEAIVKNAAKRAVIDIVNEKITEVKTAINVAIQNKINELKKEAEQSIKEAISNIINKLPSCSRK